MGDSTKELDGLIEYYGLTNWWHDTFTGDERHTIAESYHPLGFSCELSITDASEEPFEGKVVYSTSSATDFLSGLAGWFTNEPSRRIAYKLLSKAEELSLQGDALERHFLYQAKVRTYYRFRHVDDFALQTAVEACEQQIAISRQAATAFQKEYRNPVLPAHVGFEQLAIIREKEGQIEDAIRLCEQALQEGWSGKWERRIARCKKRRVNFS